MDGTMSQEEINALLNNPSGTDENPENTLTEQEKDAIGEISNISMGTAATTLFSLVNRKVEISTPVVAFALDRFCILLFIFFLQTRIPVFGIQFVHNTL